MQRDETLTKIFLQLWHPKKFFAVNYIAVGVHFVVQTWNFLQSVQYLTWVDLWAIPIFSEVFELLGTLKAHLILAIG